MTAKTLHSCFRSCYSKFFLFSPPNKAPASFIRQQCRSYVTSEWNGTREPRLGLAAFALLLLMTNLFCHLFHDFSFILSWIFNALTQWQTKRGAFRPRIYFFSIEIHCEGNETTFSFTPKAKKVISNLEISFRLEESCDKATDCWESAVEVCESMQSDKNVRIECQFRVKQLLAKVFSLDLPVLQLPNVPERLMSCAFTFQSSSCSKYFSP